MSQPPEADNYELFGLDNFIDHIAHLGSSPARQDDEYATPPGQQLTLLDMAALAQYDEPQDNVTGGE